MSQRKPANVRYIFINCRHRAGFFPVFLKLFLMLYAENRIIDELLLSTRV
jgi:hypothetical protein